MYKEMIIELCIFVMKAATIAAVFYFMLWALREFGLN